MTIKDEIPDEARQEIVRLQQALDDAIKRRNDLERRKALVGPKVWAMAKVKPNLKDMASEIANLRSRLSYLIRQHGNPPMRAPVPAEPQSPVDGFRIFTVKN